ncbi:hypothetical protein T552_04154 [Pneumocystis carinii B80]|uniref:Lysophospholipid acyltransferase n=1 Tax=Pneumocystis carinii (strain B80) TaxID=1408658 RepID=A0A0W4ZG52_PNEC8|nr:hypothetical protein T552_04154 [Pneumocystis carinii B80]KTW27345.1 hypothetical protein T552_04154 [Pneumocystis carinii B80]
MGIKSALLTGITLGTVVIKYPDDSPLWIEWLIGTIAQAIGISIGNFKLLGCLIFSYPFAIFLRKLPTKSPYLRNIFNIIISVFFLVLFNFWYALQTVLISANGTYIIVKYLKGKSMPVFVFIFLMGHLSVNHFYRQFFNIDSSMDVTSIQMVLCMKLSALAWNIYDGQQNLLTLTQKQKEYSLKEVPSLLDYLGYVFFFPSFFVGPYFDMADYYNWLTNGAFSSISNKKNDNNFKKRLFKEDGGYALKKFVYGLFYLCLFQLMSLYFSTDFVLSDEFLQTTRIYRLFYLIPLSITHRLKYYGAWSIAEGSCILSGISDIIRDSNGNIIHSSLENINPYDVETAQNVKQLFEAWNKGTNRWLKYYVYLRVISRDNNTKFKGSLITFMVSALWHGFYPGYYLSFMTGAFVQILGKYFRKHIRPFFLTKDLKPNRYKIFYDILSLLTMQLTWGYIAQPFIILNLRDSLRFWQRYDFFVHFGIILLFLLFLSPFKALVY